MARIPEAEIERLKREVAVERLAEARGVVLERRGADLVGLCPFHEDREPSLVVTPAKNLWHCLGACQAGGSAIDWVMRAEGVSFRHAVELLLADYQPSATAAAGAVKRSTVVKLPTPLERDAEDARLLLQVIAYYHETLKQSPEALAYLTKRGIASGEAVDRFQLGFANRTLGYRLPAKNRREGAAIRGQLQRMGILRPSGHEHFNGSLVIPVFGEKGEVTEVYGRKITDHLREGTPVHLYLPGPHRGVWNAEALAASPELILCESLIDALSFWCAGYRNVTAAYGVEGLISFWCAPATVVLRCSACSFDGGVLPTETAAREAFESECKITVGGFAGIASGGARLAGDTLPRVRRAKRAAPDASRAPKRTTSCAS
jgi:DNA primase